MQKNYAASAEDHLVYDYLKEEVGYHIYDRINDIKRKFNVCVELGAGRGYVSRHITSETANLVYQCELSHKFLDQAKISGEVNTYKVLSDEEFFPFKNNSLDLVVSCLVCIG